MGMGGAWGRPTQGSDRLTGFRRPLKSSSVFLSQMALQAPQLLPAFSLFPFPSSGYLFVYLTAFLGMCLSLSSLPTLMLPKTPAF